MLIKTLNEYKDLIERFPFQVTFSMSHYFFGGFGQTFFIAFLIPFIQDSYKISNSQFGLYYGACTLLSAILLPFAGRLYDQVNLKIYASIVLFFLCFGLIIVAANISLWSIFCGIFLVRFCGQGLFTHISSTSTARFFDESRGKAQSLASLGASLSEAIFPLFFIFLTKIFSWQKTLVIFAPVPSFFYIFFYLFGLKKTHHFFQVVEDDKRSGNKSSQFFLPLKNKSFTLLVLQFVLPAFILTGLFFHKIALGELKSWSQDFLAFCFVLFAVAKTISSILTGPLVDRYTARSLSQFCLIPMILSLLIFYLSNHPLAAVLYLISSGITIGFGSCVQSSVWAEIFPKHQLGSIKAVMMQCIILSTALAPPIFGWALDMNYDFHFFILFLIALTMIVFRFQEKNLDKIKA